MANYMFRNLSMHVRVVHQDKSPSLQMLLENKVWHTWANHLSGIQLTPIRL